MSIKSFFKENILAIGIAVLGLTGVVEGALREGAKEAKAPVQRNDEGKPVGGEIPLESIIGTFMAAAGIYAMSVKNGEQPAQPQDQNTAAAAPPPNPDLTAENLADLFMTDRAKHLEKQVMETERRFAEDNSFGPTTAMPSLNRLIVR